MHNTNQFYAGLAPFYHLIYPDWDASMQRQATALDSVIREFMGDSVNSVLDVSCGIGTQALGLAKLGYEMTASDLSPEAVKRAEGEAEKRSLSISFSVADMKEAYNHHGRQFDVVISCDNSIPHLLSDTDILTAFRQFYLCTRTGGGCIISVRDYEKEDLSKQQVKPYEACEKEGTHWTIQQVWDPHENGETYDVTLSFLEDHGEAGSFTHKFRSTYYAVKIPKLMELMGCAGFKEIRRLDGRFFQPVIIGTRPTDLKG